MKTLTEKYNGVLKGTFSKDQFLREARMQQPHLVTQHNSYQDAVNILLNRDIISEIKEEKPAVRENYDSLEQAKAEAKRISAEEGVVQHVNELPGGSFTVSDWYDDEFTVASFQSGLPLNEKKLTSAEKKGRDKIVKGLKKSGMSREDPSTYAIATAKARKLYELREGFQVSKNAVEVRFLKRGDVLSSGAQVVSVSSGATTPSGKADVTLKYPNGKEQTQQWGKYTKVGLKSAPQSPAEELASLKRAWSRMPEERWPESLKVQIADLESKVGNVQEGAQEVHSAVGEVLDLIKHHARALSDDDAFEFHEILKRWFNSLLQEVAEQRNPVESQLPPFEDYTEATSVARRMSVEEVSPIYVHELETKVTKYYINDQPGSTAVAQFRDGKPISTVSEAKLPAAKHPQAEVPLDALDHGIRFELDKKGLDVDCTVAEYLKAKKAAIKNLEKDLMHYHKEEGASEMPVSKTDQMVKVKLKESIKYLIKKVLTEGERPKKTFTYNGKLK